MFFYSDPVEKLKKNILIFVTKIQKKIMQRKGKYTINTSSISILSNSIDGLEWKPRISKIASFTGEVKNVPVF